MIMDRDFYKNKKYRLYLDESGDHTFKKIEDSNKKFFSITGSILSYSIYKSPIHEAFQKIKSSFFTWHSDEPVIFHQDDMVYTRGYFKIFINEKVKDDFDRQLLSILEDNEYIVITVVVDKEKQKKKHGIPGDEFNPYHFGFRCILERYCYFLNTVNSIGDIWAEPRGRGVGVDEKLNNVYTDVLKNGTFFHQNPKFFTDVLINEKIEFRSKECNIAGLQLSDLLARNSKMDILINKDLIPDRRGVFSLRLSKILESKYLRNFKTGKLWGYGMKFEDFSSKTGY